MSSPSYFPHFLLACAFVLFSSVVTSSFADESETSFVVGDSATFSCDIDGIAKEDSFFVWALGSKKLAEDESLLGGASTGDAGRYKVEKTAKTYSLTITPLAAEDDGSKFACKHDDGEDTKSLQTYRLKLKLPETTAAAAAPTTTAPTTPASEEAAVTKLAPVNEKDARSDEVEEKDDGDGITNEIGKEEKIGGNGNGALNASLSSALGALFAIVFAFCL